MGTVLVGAVWVGGHLGVGLGGGGRGGSSPGGGPKFFFECFRVFRGLVLVVWVFCFPRAGRCRAGCPTPAGCPGQGCPELGGPWKGGPGKGSLRGLNNKFGLKSVWPGLKSIWFRSLLASKKRSLSNKIGLKNIWFGLQNTCS